MASKEGVHIRLGRFKYFHVLRDLISEIQKFGHAKLITVFNNSEWCYGFVLSKVILVLEN